MNIRITAIHNKYAYVINVDNMRHGLLPILDIWETIIKRAFVTSETLYFGEHEE